jgi:hypothetical protein
MNASSTASKSYSIKAATPVITYNNSGSTTYVYISGATAVPIYYTTNGYTPSWSNYISRHPSTKKYSGVVRLSNCRSNSTLKARAFGGSFVASNIASKSIPPARGCPRGGGGR